ncbi:MAG: hypothetical protein AAF705_08640, partial [Bacteroidota bacterium]
NLMLFNGPSYQIKIQNGDRLVLERNKENLIGIFAHFTFYLLALIFLIGNSVQFTQPGTWEFLIVMLTIAFIYSLISTFRSRKQEELITFNRLNNSIMLNQQLIGKIDKIIDIQMLEHPGNDEEIDRYTLVIKMDGYGVIRFQRQPDLDRQRQIGEAVAKMAGLTFSFLSRAEIQATEQQEFDEKQYKELVQLFEGKFADKDQQELKNIALPESPFANYAKEAAQNLLDHSF